MAAKGLFFLLIFVFCNLPLYSAGTTSAPLLNFLPSPRINAMAGSGVSVPGNFNTSAANPALLGSLEGSSASALFYNSFMDSGLGYLAYCRELGPGSMSVELVEYFGGKITIEDSEGRHEGLHGKKLSAQRDTILSLGYGRRFFAPETYGGIKIRYYSSTLLEDYKASNVSADAGVFVRTLFFKTGYPNLLSRPYSPGMGAGFSLRNIGSSISYLSKAESDPLPLSVRAGLSYPLRFDAENAFLISADFIYKPNNDIIRGGIGVEYENSGMFFLRGGYMLNYEIKNFTWGLGVRHGKLQLDYSMGLTSAINSEHTFMFKMDF